MSEHKEPGSIVHVQELHNGHMNIKRKQKKYNRSTRNRLLSIQHDVDQFCKPIIETTPYLCSTPIIANERCGTWYAIPLMKDNQQFCCFKSTDGHSGIWNFSLKRLNLNVIRIVTSNNKCIILDASTTKIMPDSFSRTIPIWAAVMNRIAIRYRKLYGMPPCDYDDVDEGSFLVTPNSVVSESEHCSIKSIIDERVETLFQSKAIVNPVWLAETLQKPLRPTWITPQSGSTMDLDSILSSNCYWIICINCSDIKQSKSLIKMVNNRSNESFTYFAGAADDHESWARHLTPALFWNNISTILDSNQSAIDSFDAVVDWIVQQEVKNNEAFEQSVIASELGKKTFDQVYPIKVSIGTKRAGRPPTCWDQFDAILNVTDEAYANIYESIEQQVNFSDGHFTDKMKRTQPQTRFYLQLPVREGKRDRTQLEHWMTLGVIFVIVHARENRRILIHCAQGMDRSVAIAVAVVALFCDFTYPIQWNTSYRNFPIEKFVHYGLDEVRSNASGLSTDALETMVGREGRERLFAFLWPNGDATSFSKKSIRIALQLIQQYREIANPSRSTMQKLHRFFISTNDNRV